MSAEDSVLQFSQSSDKTCTELNWNQTTDLSRNWIPLLVPDPVQE